MGSLIGFLLIGAIAGWIAGQITKGSGFGLLGNIVVGVVGAFIGGHVLGWLGIYTTGVVGSMLSAVAGALILLFIVGLFKKK